VTVKSPRGNDLNSTDIRIGGCVRVICYGDTMVAKSETSKQAAARFLKEPIPYK